MKLRSIFSLRKWVRLFLESGTAKMLSDEWFIRLEYYSEMGKILKLSQPVTFNEKLQWLKLNMRDPLHTQMVDKYAAKGYVASIIGEEYIVPTLGVWDTPEQIDFDSLPGSFVLKVTHDSGGIVICKDKKKLDIEATISKLRRSLARDYYLIHREWPYKDVHRRIIAEPYLEDIATGELRDYKFFAFNGKVGLVFVVSDRQKNGEEAKFDYFDREFNLIRGMRNGHINSKIVPSKPQNYDLMLRFAELLSRDLPHIRVDFYEADGKLYFGELTFFNRSGFIPFDPPEWDIKLGEYIDLEV